MRKFYSFVLMIGLIILLCGCSGSNKLKDYFTKLGNADNFTMLVSHPNILSITYKLDGNKTQASSSMMEIDRYLEVIDNKYYIYEKDSLNNHWYKNEVTKQEVDYSFGIMFDHKKLDANWFKAVGDHFELKTEYYSQMFYAKYANIVENVILKLEGDKCLIIFDYHYPNKTVPCEVEITNINSSPITLPEVNPT